MKKEMYELINLYGYGKIDNQNIMKEVSDGNSKYCIFRIGENDWVPIISQKSRDIITGEKYYSSNLPTYIFKARDGISCSKNLPYYNSCYNFQNHMTEFTSNLDDYDKLFYDDFKIVYPSEIIGYIELIEKYGKQKYLDCINEFRTRLMYTLYNSKMSNSNKEYNEERKTNIRVKELIKKIK